MEEGNEESRRRILDAVRGALGRGPLTKQQRAVIESRLLEPVATVVPARGQLNVSGRRDLFVAMAKEAAATVTPVASLAAAPGTLAEFLSAHDLPNRGVLAPDPDLEAIPWHYVKRLDLRRGKAKDEDAFSVTGAFAGIAESGTLMLLSGPASPTTLNFMPLAHVVILMAKRIVGTYEEAWARLRARGKGMPRNVNFITGPSRTADIEQTMQIGAHGPRYLHIVLVDGRP